MCQMEARTRRRTGPLRGNASLKRAKNGELTGLVGVRGFEPPTPSSRTTCATRLRHTPPQSVARYSLQTCPPQVPNLGLFIGRTSVAQQACSRYLPPRFEGCAWSRSRSVLGRRQVVRQRILIPSFGGSNPPAPANQSSLSGCFPSSLTGLSISSGWRVAQLGGRRRPVSETG